MAAWKRVHKKREGVSSGAAVLVLKNWLKFSFGRMMEQVWLEFPKQKYTQDPITGDYLPLLNYLILSKKHRYRAFFFQANVCLRDHIKQKIFDSIFIYGRKMKLE